MLKLIIKILKKINFIPYIIIPKGDYCYRYKFIFLNKKQKHRFPMIKSCRYWGWDKRYPLEDVGYCKYLKIGDKDKNSQGLLFDQIKECGINEYKEF